MEHRKQTEILHQVSVAAKNKHWHERDFQIDLPEYDFWFFLLVSMFVLFVLCTTTANTRQHPQTLSGASKMTKSANHANMQSTWQCGGVVLSTAKHIMRDSPIQITFNRIMMMI